MQAGVGERRDDRVELRLLRFLGGGPADASAGAAADKVLFSRPDAGHIGVPVPVVRSLARRGLIRLDGRKACLTGLGRTHCARLLSDHQGHHREQASGFVEIAGRREEVAINLSESPLAGLARRRTKSGAAYLEKREVDAGERLRSDYTRARIMPRLGVNWDAVGGAPSGSGDGKGIEQLTQSALAARRRVEGAIEAVGPELSGILVDVCCFLKGLEQVEAERQWPPRSAKLMLKSALAALARHYSPGHHGSSGSRTPILHWGSEDYRPALR